MIDADAAGVVGRLRQLDESCRLSRITPRTDVDRVVLLVPERNIETWLAYLNGNVVDAATNYPKLEKPGGCKEHARVLAGICAGRQLRQPAPQSLIVACGEYRSVFR